MRCRAGLTCDEDKQRSSARASLVSVMNWAESEISDVFVNENKNENHFMRTE